MSSSQQRKEQRGVNKWKSLLQKLEGEIPERSNPRIKRTNNKGSTLGAAKKSEKAGAASTAL